MPSRHETPDIHDYRESSDSVGPLRSVLLWPNGISSAPVDFNSNFERQQLLAVNTIATTISTSRTESHAATNLPHIVNTYHRSERIEALEGVVRESPKIAAASRTARALLPKRILDIQRRQRTASFVQSKIEELDKLWGSSYWIPADVRAASASSPGDKLILDMLKLTHLAIERGIPLPSLWQASGLLRRAVTQGARDSTRPRLTTRIVESVVKAMQFDSESINGSRVGSPNTQPNHESQFRDDESSPEDADNSSVMSFEVARAASHSPSHIDADITNDLDQPSGEDLDISLVPDLIAHQEEDDGVTSTHTDSKRKLEDVVQVDTEDDFSAPLIKRRASTALNVDQVYHYLSSKTWLKDDVVNFLGHALYSCYGNIAQLRVLDPLWFNGHPGNLPQKIKGFGHDKPMCCMINLYEPRHWAFIVITKTPEPHSGLAVSLHDSLHSGRVSEYVRLRLQSWATEIGLSGMVTVTNQMCPRQIDDWSCGYHALACMRRVLTDEACDSVTTFDSYSEQDLLLQLLKTLDPSSTDQPFRILLEKLQLRLRNHTVDREHNHKRQITNGTAHKTMDIGQTDDQLSCIDLEELQRHMADAEIKLSQAVTFEAEAAASLKEMEVRIKFAQELDTAMEASLKTLDKRQAGPFERRQAASSSDGANNDDPESANLELASTLVRQIEKEKMVECVDTVRQTYSRMGPSEEVVQGARDKLSSAKSEVQALRERADLLKEVETAKHNLEVLERAKRSHREFLERAKRENYFEQLGL